MNSLLLPSSLLLAYAVALATPASVAKPHPVFTVADSDTAEVGPLWDDPIFRAPAVTVLPPGGADFPLLDDEGCAGAEVRINGKGPYRFIIESGEAESNLTARLAQTLGITGNEAPLDSISLGNAQLRGLTVETSYPIDDILSGFDGVLGLNTYHDELLTLDYPDHRAHLSEGTLPPPNGRDILPLMHIAGHHLFRFPITVEGQTVMAVLDTQNHGTFWVAPEATHALSLGPLTSAGTFVTPNVGATEAKNGTLSGNVVIAGTTFPRPVLEISPMKPGYEMLWNVGCGVLQNFVVTIDQRHQRVRFTRGATPLRLDLPSSSSSAHDSTSAKSATVTSATAVDWSLPFRNPDLALSARVADLVGRLTLEEKVSQLSDAAAAIPRLGIPAYSWRNEALHGVGRNGLATVFPQSIGLAASFDDSLLYRISHVIAREARAKYREALESQHDSIGTDQGITFFSPNINIFRDPRWGRGQETYGEDPWLTARMGVAFVRGMRGDDSTYWEASTTAKHYAAHSGPDSSRDEFEAHVNPYDLTDTYLPHFEALVREAAVPSVMAAYSGVNGDPMVANSYLLNQVLREQWGFKGFVVSDCGAVNDVHETHHKVPTALDAAVLSLKSGTDMDCGDGEFGTLVDAVHQGRVTEAEIDTSLVRVLTVRFRVGLFDPPARVPYNSIPVSDNDRPEHRALARVAGDESIVLLKNAPVNGHPVLPLQLESGQRLAIIGAVGGDTSVLYGTYNGISSAPVTLADGIRKRAESAGATVEVVTHMHHETSDTANFGAALAAAQRADVIVMTMGITPAMAYEEHDRPSADMPAIQDSLLKQVVALGKPVVVVFTSGGSLSMPELVASVPALVDAWFPGEEGGNAVADVLFGDYNPSAHLPITFYKAIADLPPYEDYDMRRGLGRTYRYFTGTPLFPFGYGLSYTTFRYRGLQVPAAPVAAGDSAHVQVEVSNTGKRKGAAVVEVYVTKLTPADPRSKGQPTRPIRALAAFRRVPLEPGQHQLVTLTLRPSAFSTVTEDGKRLVTSGQYLIAVGGQQPDSLHHYASPAEGVTGHVTVVGQTVEIQ